MIYSLAYFWRGPTTPAPSASVPTALFFSLDCTSTFSRSTIVAKARHYWIGKGHNT